MGKNQEACSSTEGWIEYVGTTIIKILGTDPTPIIRDFPTPQERIIIDEKTNAEEQKIDTSE